MRVLHVGSGFRPWRRGGLVAYIEDLMREQVRRGDEVAYFFSGRQYPRPRRVRLRRWSRDDVPMYEVVDSPLYDHGRQPRLEVGEPVVEGMLSATISEFRPDVVHVQELAGLPSSVIDVAQRLAVPVVVTLQDYFAVCPAFRLLDADGRSCLRHDAGAACLATAAADPREPALLVEATVAHDVARWSALRYLDRGRRDRLGRLVARAVAQYASPSPGPRGDAADYRRRRELNVARLSRAERVVAMSRRVADIHAELGVAPERMRTIHLTLAHIERLRPVVLRPTRPVTFATVAAFESETKGARLLLDAVRRLSASPAAERFRVVVHGWIAPQFEREAAQLDAIELRRPFAPHELDDVLDGVDVGLMPSVWEEAYGYAGIEFLAKGIPVIANAVGGMTDYVRDGETGWLNRSRSAEELARIMASVIERPEQVARLNAALRASRDAIVKPMAGHADEMDALYAEVVAARHNVAAMGSPAG